MRDARTAVAMVCTGVRPEEKLLVNAFQARGVDLAVVDDRTLHGDLGSWPVGMPPADVVILRSKSHWRNLVLARWLEGAGAITINPAQTIEWCGDKVASTIALVRGGVPTLSASVALTPDAGRPAAEAVGYPLVVKPVVGSWGRLVGKVNDADALETVLEHKEAVGGAPHAVSYLQSFVNTGGRDIRSFVVGGTCIAAIHRSSSEWRTNTARGAMATNCPLDDDLRAVSEQAAAAVCGPVVAVDLFAADGGYLVNEVNGTMEFRNSVDTTGVDIPGLIADYAVERARQQQNAPAVA